MHPSSAATPAGPTDGDAGHWVGGTLSPAGAAECLRRMDVDSALESRLEAALPAGVSARPLLEQVRDGVVGSEPERMHVSALEQAAYGPGGDPGAEESLFRLQTMLRDKRQALDPAVRSSGILASVVPAAPSSPAAAGSAGSAGSASAAGAADSAVSAARAPGEPGWERVPNPDAARGLVDAPPASAHPLRARWRLWVAFASVCAIAVAAASVVVVGVLAPRPSLDIFTRPGELPDSPGTSLVLDISSQGQLGEGPIRYIGDIGEASFFVTLVRDTFHNPDDPQEGVCLLGHFGDEAGGTVSVNCVVRADFADRGITLPLTLTPSGEYAGINVDVEGASSGAAWGPTGGLREIGPQELRDLTTPTPD